MLVKSFDSEKIFNSKRYMKICIQPFLDIIMPQNFFCPSKIFGQKNFAPQKIVGKKAGSKKILAEKMGVKKSIGLKRVCINKNFGSKNIGVQKILKTSLWTKKLFHSLI